MAIVVLISMLFVVAFAMYLSWKIFVSPKDIKPIEIDLTVEESFDKHPLNTIFLNPNSSKFETSDKPIKDEIKKEADPAKPKRGRKPGSKKAGAKKVIKKKKDKGNDLLLS